jgi:hypothetical protein
LQSEKGSDFQTAPLIAPSRLKFTLENEFGNLVEEVKADLGQLTGTQISL